MGKIRINFLVIVTSLLLVVSGCGMGVNDPQQNNANFGRDDYKEITTPNNELAFKLLKEVGKDEHGNAFISPTSLLMALSMVYNGSDGETKKEIAETLQASGIEVSDLNKANASLLAMLKKNTEKITVDIANSIWINDEFQFHQEFEKNVSDFYQAELQAFNSMDGEAAKTINQWVEKATREKIKDIVEDPLNPDLVMILLNAIYFNGEWTYEFDKQLTENREFFLADGTTTNIPFMNRRENFLYMENDDFQAVSLPYGDGEMSMKVFLPKVGKSLTDFENSLTNEKWQDWTGQFAQQEGIVNMPKFKMEYEIELNSVLQKLGMPTAFTEEAEFPRLIQEDESLMIDKVKQKTFIDVHEKGTEAAAVTSVEVKLTSAPMDEFYMDIHRPFFFVISDDEAEAILFMGSVSNPQ